MTPTPDIGTCLSAGWELFKQRPWLLIGATLIAGLINGLAAKVPFATLLTYPLLLAGLYLMIMRLDRGRPLALANLFDGLPRILPLVLASLLTSVLIALGLVLLVIPGLYLAVAYGFTTLNIIDRDMDFWPAMESSRKTITTVFWPYLGLILVLGLITIVAALPFGLGLPVAVPVCMAAQYRFYRSLHPSDPVGGRGHPAAGGTAEGPAPGSSPGTPSETLSDAPPGDAPDTPPNDGSRPGNFQA